MDSLSALTRLAGRGGRSRSTGAWHRPALAQMRRRCVAHAVLIAAAATLCAPPAAAQFIAPVATATRVEHAPRMDGTVDDPLWARAEPVSGFKQHEPREGEPATEPTDVRILYTAHAVYFGVTCHDSVAARIAATELRRDAPQGFDDRFQILIDVARDRRNAYVFQLNPFGTQRDGIITEESTLSGDDYDNGWDGVWRSDARSGPDGWTATVEIPFSTLNVTRSHDLVWGLNFKRAIRRTNEEDLWSAWPRAAGITKVSEAGELRGLTDIDSGRLLVMKPYLLASYRQQTPGDSGAALTGGVDVKIGLQSNLVANLTVNTDFADADVDQQQFNLTPFPLFYPEKRQFFLENAGIFNFAMTGKDLLFFSRQIGIDSATGEQVPIRGGGKITGFLGGLQVGALDIATRVEGPSPAANYAVVRLKQSLSGISYIGVMGIDKHSNNGADTYNRVAGLDARIGLSRNAVLYGYAAQSHSPGVAGDHGNVGIETTYHGRFVDVDASRRRIGVNFNDETGFVSRRGVLADSLDLKIKLRPRSQSIRELDVEPSVFHALDGNGALQTQELNPILRVVYDNGATLELDPWDRFAQRLVAPFQLYPDVTIPPELYRWTRHLLSFASAQDRRFTATVSDRFGGYYTGELNEATVAVAYRPTARLSLSASENWNRFRLPQSDLSVSVASLQLNYSWSRTLTVSATTQANSANPHPVSANVRLRYNYRPDSDLFVVLNSGQTISSLPGSPVAPVEERRIEVKWTYALRD
jgi:hypothetical protein